MDVVKAVGSAGPDVASGRCGEGKDDVAGEAVAHAEGFGFTERRAGAGHSVQAIAAGPDPKYASVIFYHGRGCVGRKTVARTKGAEAFVAQDVESAGFRADPEVALTVFEN